MTWLSENFDYVSSLTLRHVWLSAIPIAIGFLVALPIGWYASNHPRLRGPALSTVGILYTIPSLPLIVFLPSILGTKYLSPINQGKGTAR